MNEKIYLIQFRYNGDSHSISILSHHNFSKGNNGDKLWMLEEIRAYLKENNLTGSTIENVRLFGKDGELIVCIKNL